MSQNLHVILCLVTMLLIAGSALAESTGSLESTPGLSSYVSAFDSPDATIRLEAARALGERRNPESVPVLIRALTSDPIPEVRGWCVHALHQIGTAEAHEAISNAAQNDRNDRVRDLAIALCSDCTPVSPSPELTSSEIPTPFPSPPATPAQTPTETTPTQPTPDIQHPQAQSQTSETSLPQDPRLRTGAVRSLATGVVLLVVSSIPFAIGGVIVQYWEKEEVLGSTTTWSTTSAYPGSIVLFTLGSALALAGLVLTPIGAVRLSRLSETSQRRSRISTLSPFAGPSAHGGVIFGLGGQFY